MQKPHVTTVITSLIHAGAETHTVRTLKELKKRGWDQSVISLLPPVAHIDELANAGIPLETLNMRKGIPDPRAILRLSFLFKKYRPTIVHGHMVHANLLARVARLISPVPLLISHAHNVNEGGKWRELAYRYTDRLSDVTVNVSQAAVDRYIAVKAAPKEKICCISNGVDAQLFQPNAEVRVRMRKALEVDDQFVWLAVGRMEAAKDYPTMLRAFVNTKEKYPDARLIIAGSGSLRDEIERLINEFNLSTVVSLLGVRSDVPDLMRAADAYVMSSLWEGMPNVLLEASSSALPIVATNVGGNTDVVQNGISGLIVPKASHEDLSQAMASVMGMSSDARRQMGDAGRQHVVEHHSLSSAADKWEELYQDLLSRLDKRCNAGTGSSR